MGKCRHHRSPPGLLHPAWLFYTKTSERSNEEMFPSVLPSFGPLSSTSDNVGVRKRVSPVLLCVSLCVFE